MSWTLIVQSLIAFNANAANHIAYQISTSWWLVALIACACICSVLGVKEEAAAVVTEEQDIL